MEALAGRDFRRVECYVYLWSYVAIFFWSVRDYLKNRIIYTWMDEWECGYCSYRKVNCRGFFMQLNE